MISWLPAVLREPRRPIIAIAAGWALAFFPSIALSFLTQELLPNVARPAFEITPATITLFVLFAPLIETLVMAAVLEVLLRFVGRPVAVVLSAVGWGVAHSLAAPAWGLVIWWPFLIFSALYVTWREKGVLAGIGVAAAAHMLQNLIPALLLLRWG